jgi:protein subunit release factor B
MNEYVIQISSGVGLEEVRRFVFKLAGRLERLCEKHGLAIRDIAFQGDEDAPRSVALRVRGDVIQWIGAEQGSHVLVHRSAQRGRSSRKRWFAAVTIIEAAEDTHDGAHIDRDDLIITACRAGGPGGQHVNKVSTAVRVEHVPSGINVRVASERSQKANVDHAVRRLAALLQTQAQTRRAAEAERRRLAHYSVVRGNAVRSYALTEDGALVEAEASS